MDYALRGITIDPFTMDDNGDTYNAKAIYQIFFNSCNSVMKASLENQNIG